MKYPRAQQGFTLIELIVACAVVGILSAIAISTFRNQSVRANRTDGRSMLLQIQLAEQKFYLQNNTYTADLVSASPVGLGIANAAPVLSPRGYYTLSVAAGATGTLATSFLVTAAANGTQATSDPNCVTYTVDDSANRTPLDATGCWK